MRTMPAMRAGPRPLLDRNEAIRVVWLQPPHLPRGHSLWVDPCQQGPWVLQLDSPMSFG